MGMIRARRAQPWLGTLVEIAAYGESATQLQTAITGAFNRIADIHRRFSFQSPDSELTEINRTAHRGPVDISTELSTVLCSALEIAAASRGLFDPTIAPMLVGTGHLPYHAGQPREPHAGEWEAIELGDKVVRFAFPLLLDLSGIAKGYAVDAALEQLRDEGLSAAIVNAGGDLACFGEAVEPVRLRHPTQPTSHLHLIDLREGAVATSAGYAGLAGSNSPAVSPLRHPKTGASLCLMESVSVLAARCMHADALTKVVAADPQAALPVLQAYGAESLRLAVVDDELRMHVSDGSKWTPVECHGLSA